MSNDTENAHFSRFLSIFYILKIVVFMNNVGVLKTQDGSTIFNNRLSWFIYTPTKNLRIIKKINTFWYFILNLTNIAPNIVNPTKINTLTYHTTCSEFPIKTTFFLYKYEKPKKIPTFTDYQHFTKKLYKTYTYL